MEITKTVPVTIEIDEPNICSSRCQFFEDLSGGELGCRRYGDITDGRHADCISEFSTGEKPAVVPWEDSNIGDVVRVRGKRVVIVQGEKCNDCCFDGTPYCRAETKEGWACDNHPSGCGIYFTEVKK